MTTASGVDQGFGRYRLRYRIARGGMASVYLAQVQGPGGFEKWVAVKTIHPHCSDDPRFVRMFLDEARLTARLSHPNICAVHDFGELDGTYYIAMEHLRGEPLRSVVNKGIAGRVMPPELVARLVADAARGLHAAHEAVGDDGAPLGIVHRDVSPDNIFVLYDGIAKVVDFGIARARDRLAGTATGEVKGKLAYMAPEQLDTKEVDRRVDVFALGVVLWEATVLRRLFKRESAAMTVAAVLRDRVPLPSDLLPDYPVALERVVMRALAREPGARFQTMEEMADALDAFVLSELRPAGPAQVAAWMKSAFADRLEKLNAMLRSEPDAAGAVVDVDASGSSTIVSGLAEDRVTVERAARRRRTAPSLVVALALLVAAAAAFGGWVAGRRAGDEAAEGPLPGGAVEARAPADGGAGDGAVAPSADALVLLAASPEARDSARAAADAGSGLPAARRGKAAPDRRPPPPPPAEPGYLNLISVPVAEVWLGGRSLGTTPLQKVRLPAGRHRLRLQAARGEGTLGQVVTIRPDEVTYLSVRLEL